jgi:type II restriction enzyme
MKFNALKSTFQDSIFTWDYFTDFEKVKKNVKKIEKELNLLNYLIGKENIEEEFLSLVEEYPKVRKILPILIATRDDKLSKMPIITDFETLLPENKKYIFNDPISENIKKELLIFFRESGLKDIFENKHIKNLVDYCFGVEVGMDTNGRKKRTGDLMEDIVGNYLETFCQENKDFTFLSQATKDKIKKAFDCDIEIDKNSRRFDFALYNQKDKKLYLIEVNYYGGGGSKLKATAGEYKYLNDFLKAQNLSFIWVTDGLGWMTALRPLEETFNHNDYVINLSMLKNGILKDIVNK